MALNFGRKQGESSNQSSNKRQQEETEDPNPAVSQASTATITEETGNTNPNLLSPFSTQTYHCNTDTLAIKPKRLKEKSARYTSQKDFYLSALTANLNSGTNT